ncbi:hypothetical protein B0H14DRAFT_2764746 [Mycena olivaceomarginata]|nr:hypothetical protein B0H14DRAFT_2764746 [Mycena olivaceomarginata]
MAIKFEITSRLRPTSVLFFQSTMPPAKSNTVTVNGRQYTLSEFMPEVVPLAKELASNARLLADSPLPVDTDLSEVEQREVQAQIPAMLILPPQVISIFWSVFASAHLPALASALRRLSHATQRQALSTAIQILSLLPDPKKNPYFRKFLRSPTASKGIPNIVANAFVQGTTWKRPSGPGHHCTLIIHTLFWCDPKDGDDRKACVDAGIRTALASAVQSLLESINDNNALAPDRAREFALQRVEMERLLGVLQGIDSMPGSHFLDSTRGYLVGQVDDVCGGDMCGEEAEMWCSKCKTVRYCGEKCQAWHWKNGHKFACFKTDY